ncbi:MAG: hypothetical protein QOI74_2177 [Micromonosporaceae bacterium]|nr:hypothetical protein [Micromonosporaceae bacterium]
MPVDDDPLASAARELYELPPEEFVAARDEAVRNARSAGDRTLATALGKLRRPTVGAWAVNRLARHRPELVDELFALGEQLRTAQRDLRGDDLRELSTRRRAMIDTLYRAAIALARREHRKDALPVNEIEATLMAALADPAVAEQVRGGQLVKTVEYTGFGETPRPQLRLVQGGQSPTVSTSPPAPGPTAPTPVIGADSQRVDSGRNRIDQAPEDPLRPPSSETSEVDGDQGRAPARDEAKEPVGDEAREEAERRFAEHAASAELRAAERVTSAERKRIRAAAHRELLAARTELSAAQAARTSAERAVKAATRRVEKATAVLTGLERDDPT